MNRPQKTESQYHHFIPRFLLRNFAVFKNPGKITPKTSTNKKKRAPAPTRLNLLNLQTRALEQADVAHTFGFVDLYRDFDASEPEQHDLEKRLSRLEGDASEILRKAKRMQEAGKHEFQLTRREKDLLRRFIFIMLYRNRTMAGRYEKSTADYDCDDRDDMLAYMKAKGFAQPRSVYLSNIRAFMDVDLSTEWQVWSKEILRRAYPSDASWFFKNMQMSFIAFCIPQVEGDEFLMTQNVYSIFEGPNCGGVWTDFHIFAPVSPKLMIITRHFLLSDGVDEDEASRQELLQWNNSKHMHPGSAGSCLEDLPIAKARNNYSHVVNGKSEPLPINMSRDKHIFYFRFFPLEARHVQKINTILLEEAPGTIALVYKSPESLRRALEFYLTDNSPGFKQVYRLPPTDLKDPQDAFDTLGSSLGKWPEDEGIPYLQLLERIAQTLGSTVIAKYKLNDFSQAPMGPSMGPEFKAFVRRFNGMMASLEEPEPGPNMMPHLLRTYKKLGPGTLATFTYDFDQARCIVQLVIKSDSMMRMQKDATKTIIRQNRQDLISKLPPRRVWLFVKHLRDLSKHDPNTMQLRHGQSVIMDGVEDAFANAHNVFTPESLSRIIQKAANLDIFLSSRPNFGLVEGWNLIQEGPERLFQEIAIVFDKPGEAIDDYENRLQLIRNFGRLGSIRNCGIRAIEEVLQTLSTQPCPALEAFETHPVCNLLSDEQLRELWLRNCAETVFEEVLKGSLAPSDLRELKRVMFQSLYRPKFGARVRA